MAFRHSLHSLVEPYVTSSLVYGSLFGLMAIGLTLTYMTTKVPNFAYGSFVTIGLYTSYTLFKVDGISPYLVTPIAFAITGAASVAMYLGILRPMARRGSPLVSLMIATFGLDIGFIGVFGIYTDYLQARYRLTDAKQFFQLQTDFTVAGIQGIIVVTPLVLAAIGVALYIMFTRTSFGIAMRASVENASLARVLGINVERVNLVSWLLAGGFAGLAGCLYTVWQPGGTSTGSDLIVEIFASSILGGLTSIFGAIFGGLAIGSSEDTITTFLGQGFGVWGAGAIAALLLLIGFTQIRRGKIRSRVFGAAIAGLGAYILADIALGYPSDFLAPGLVNGFGSNVTPFQKAIPLVIMVGALLVLPKGLVSLNLKKLFRRGAK
jgi:branched-chain amino acid transport system permease protein